MGQAANNTGCATKVLGKGSHLTQQGPQTLNTHADHGGHGQWPPAQLLGLKAMPMASNLCEFSGKTCSLHQCTITALMPRTGGNMTYIMVQKDRNSSEYPFSPQEGGGPCSMSIHNGSNTKPDILPQLRQRLLWDKRHKSKRAQALQGT